MFLLRETGLLSAHLSHDLFAFDQKIYIQL